MTRHSSVKPDFHIVVTIAEHACDHGLKRVLKLLIYRLQMYLVKHEYLRSLQLCEDQGIHGKLKKHVCNHVLATLRLIWRLVLTLFDMGFFEPSVMGGGGHKGPHHNLEVIAKIIMKFGTDIKLDVFYTMVTKKFVTSLLLRNYDVITCILDDAQA